MSHFDQAARNWDSNPMHFDRSAAVAASIHKQILLSRNMTALEYGAGTGILSFMLHDVLHSITLMDSSAEMIAVINEKIRISGVANLTPLQYDLENNDYTDSRFDLIFNQMVLHHVGNIEQLFKKFHSMMNPGAHLAIADLYTEDGSFHGDWFNGHKGFDPDNLSKILIQNGFTNPHVSPCFEIIKQSENQQLKKYPIFLLVASK